jgi:hypothetical protein
MNNKLQLLCGTAAALVVSCLVACSAPPAGSSSGHDSNQDSEDSTPSEREATDMVVAASSETKSEIGVAEWYVVPGEKGVTAIKGVDDEGRVVAHFTSRVSKVDAETASIEFTLSVPTKTTAKLEVTGENVKTITNGFENDEASQRIVRQAAQDVALSTSATKQSSSLRTESLHPLAGGELVKDAGITLAKDAGAPIKRPDYCLRDSSGKSCAVKFMFLMGMTALTAASCVLTLVPPVTAGAAVGCAIGVTSVLKDAYDMDEQGCKDRPCPATS